MSPAKRNIVIAVTGLNAVESPGPGVAVIRSIRECRDFNVKIIGLAYEALEPGIYMPGIADKSYQIPYPSAGTNTLLSRLDYIHNIENIDILIPNFDAELFNFILLQETLKNKGIRMFLPDMKMFTARDKINLGRFGKENNLPVPDDIVISRPEEIRKAADKLGFPVVVKGKFYDAYVCNSIDQAEKSFYKLQAKWGVPVIFQEFLTGNEMNIAVLGDGQGKAVSIVPMRKLYITEKGKAWAGVTIEDDTLKDLALRFTASTKWRGGCELEVMMTQGNKPYILEINPRFPAWIYLAAAAGQNQPAALVKMAMGQKVKPFDSYDVGKVFVRYSWDNIIDISKFHEMSGRGEI